MAVHPFQAFVRGSHFPRVCRIAQQERETKEAERRDDHPLYVRRLQQGDHGALPHESAGQVLARPVRQVLRVPVCAQRKVLLAREQALLQERLLQVKQRLARSHRRTRARAGAVGGHYLERYFGRYPKVLRDSRTCFQVRYSICPLYKWSHGASTHSG